MKITKKQSAIIAGVIAVLVAGGLTFALTRHKPAPAPVAVISPSATPSPSIQPSAPAPKQGSETVGVNGTYSRYINHRLGYSIYLPYRTYIGSADCRFDKADNSYRPVQGSVGVRYFETGDTVYFAPEYVAHLSGESRQPDNTSDFSQCNKITTTIPRLQDSSNFELSKWEIITQSVGSDAELTSFIKNRYGQGCSVGERKPIGQSDTFDVSVAGFSMTGGCPVNYATVIRYSPSRQKVVSWNLGQSVSFTAGPDGSNPLDQEMVNSFRFED